MEALALQGVASPQDDLPLYPYLHADRVYHRWSVFKTCTQHPPNLYFSGRIL